MNVEIKPLIIDLVCNFIRSSRDALDRSRSSKSTDIFYEPTGLNIFPHCRAEAQAAIESIVFSFLTIEATINYYYAESIRGRRLSGLDKWLHQKWNYGLSVYDRFTLLLIQESTCNMENFQNLTQLFKEFISFRNRIVHATPEEYNALVERVPNEDDFVIHELESLLNRKSFLTSGFCNELGKIKSVDAERAYEIMLLAVCLLDEQLAGGDTEFMWRDDSGNQCYKKLREIVCELEVRHYPSISPESFVPEIVRKTAELIKQAHGEAL